MNYEDRDTHGINKANTSGGTAAICGTGPAPSAVLRRRHGGKAFRGGVGVTAGLGVVVVIVLILLLMGMI